MIYGTTRAKSLGNIGWPGTMKVSQLFVAQKTGSLVSLRFFHRFNTPYHQGYSGGTGGKFAIELWVNADRDRLFIGFMSGINTLYPWLNFSSPIPVTAGEVCRIVYTQVDPAPETNWSSINGLVHPLSDPLDSHVTPDGAFWWSNGWQKFPTQVPVYELHYADGFIQGRGYIDVPSSAIASLAQRPGQLFVPPRDLTCSGGGVSLTEAYMPSWAELWQGKNLLAKPG